MHRGAWWVTVCGVTKSWTQLKQLSTHIHVFITDQNNMGAPSKWHVEYCLTDHIKINCIYS